MRRKMLGLLPMLNGVRHLSLTLARITSLRAQPSNGRTAASANLLVIPTSEVHMVVGSRNTRITVPTVGLLNMTSL